MIRVAVKFLTKVILACVTFLFLPISCTRDSVLPPQTDQPTYFDFKTVRDYHLNVNLNQGGAPTGLIRFDVYTEEPFVERGGGQIFNRELAPVFTGITDNEGKFSDKMRLPTTVKKLYLCVKRIGNPTLLMTTISGETVTFDVKSASKSSGTKNQYSAVSLTNAYALASWDALGYPSNVFTTDNVSVGLLFDITTSLPEGEALPLRGTSFLDDTTQTNLVITKNTAIDLVFVHEGAGYKNVLGYYTYPTNNPPSIISVVRKNIAFPNVLFNSSGGGLQTGNRIRLKYWNGTAYQDTFPAGQTLAWFLVADGFSSTTKIVQDGLYINYSDKQFNVESDASLKQHMVLLHDKVRNVMVLSFEETRRDAIGCDQDFNDAIFYAVPSEEDAVQTNGFSSILRGSDYDEDGIIDYEDEYPLDGSLAYSVHYPAHMVFGSLAFEDLWPSQGDYDMNDLVCDYNIVHYLNPQNKVVRADGVIQVRASGANSQNGFGMQLGVSPSVVQSLYLTGASLTHISLDEKGLESGHSKVNIILFDDVHKLFGAPVGSFINTDMSQPLRDYKMVSFSLSFTTPQSSVAVTAPPYNPYLIVGSGSGSRDREVHLPGYPPTVKANPAYFGMGQDVTNPGLNRYYIALNNMPYAIHTPVLFSYPIEKAAIGNAHAKFSPWSTSFGAQFANWYLNNQGYRNSGLIYNKEPVGPVVRPRAKTNVK